MNYDDHVQLLSVWRQAAVHLPMNEKDNVALIDVLKSVESEMADQETAYYDEQVAKHSGELSKPSSVYLQLTTQALDLIQRYLPSVVSIMCLCVG